MMEASEIFNIRKSALSILPDPNCAIDLYGIMSKNNIRFIEHDIGVDKKGKKILGACKSMGLQRLVVVSPSIDDDRRKRFTIAHEIGHLFLHHGNQICISTDFEIIKDTRMKESQANTFAAELLLPYNCIFEKLRKNDVSFDLVSYFSDFYNVSLLATAIRLIKLDTGMSAAVYHNGKGIEWIVKSEACRFILNGNCSEEYAQANQVMKRKISPDLWVKNPSESLSCIEEYKYFNRLDTYLSILNFNED